MTSLLGFQGFHAPKWKPFSNIPAKVCGPTRAEPHAVLFDQGTPVPLRQCLPSHSIVTVYEQGWSRLANGDLLRVAEQEQFDVLVTTDQNIQHQQNLTNYRLAIVVLPTTSWPMLQRHLGGITAAIDDAVPGHLVHVRF